LNKFQVVDLRFDDDDFPEGWEEEPSEDEEE